MFNNYLPIVTDDGAQFYVEVEVKRVSGSQPTSGLIERTLDKSVEVYQKIEESMKSVATAMVKTVRSLDQQLTPDEFEIGIALKITAEGDVILTKIGGEAQLSVKMTYKSLR